MEKYIVYNVPVRKQYFKKVLVIREKEEEKESNDFEKINRVLKWKGLLYDEIIGAEFYNGMEIDTSANNFNQLLENKDCFDYSINHSTKEIKSIDDYK